MNDTSANQLYDFSGSIPAHYDQYLGPLFFEPYAIEVATRIDPSTIQIALELACGTGRVTKHLRQALSPTTKLIASDVSPDMMALAQQKLKDENIVWQIIDAQELPFQDESIDLVVCCFGFMFVPDKLKAFSEAHRVLRQGGMLLFATWDRLETIGTSSIYRKIAARYLPGFLPETLNLPFSMWDEKLIKELLVEAGFSKISIEKITKDSISPSAKDAAEGLTRGGAIYNELMNRNPAWIEEIKILLEKELSEKFGEAPMIAPMSAVISHALK
jgi:ubiquinone/menaquinone biosynthesis C-methylase UbiE